MNGRMFPTSNDPLYGVSEAALRGSWYDIDLGAIRHNYRQLRGHLSAHVKVFACLKRNAYGCGAGPVAAALACENIDGFAVASMLDALAIRRAGVSNPILLYPGVTPVGAAMVESLDLIVSVSSLDELQQWSAVVNTLRVFIKLDLGFFRAGVTPAGARKLVAAAMADPTVRVEGIYAHMSELPTVQSTGADAQYQRLVGIIADLDNQGIRPPVVMMSSTDGVLNHPEMDFDAVDPGALFVGIGGPSLRARAVELRPALKTISTSLVCVKRLDPSLGPLPGIPGYKTNMSLGVIGMGWGDGLPRHIPEGAVGLVHGRRARLLAPAHLEHIRIDLTGIPNARTGDEVILLGRQGPEMITHDEVCAIWGTDAVGLYADLRDHVPRRYL
ncbi:alanine racemase (plasmid) [Agrobacterium vitis]|nr:alanine racemase [Agrobacterium vitis]